MAEPRRLEREAPAKINLRLRILSRCEDGFHGIESLYLRLALADRLVLETGGEPGIRLELAGEGAAADGVASVPTGPENLVWRAVEGFCEAVGQQPAVTVRLHKRIPAGAGLGGGSTDAAAALGAMNELEGEPLEGRDLLRLAGEIGSDVPFFAADLPAALGWGRGGRLLPVRAAPPRPMLVAVPDVRIGAAEAYAWVDEDREAPEEPGAARGPGSTDPGPAGPPGAAAGHGDRAGGELLPSAADWEDWETLERLAGNDFESAVFARFPELGWWKEELEGEGARLGLLCGSGSALVGIFTDPERRDAAARRMEAAETVRVLRTRGPV